jgi:NAD(P)H-dependent FMN reductase
MNMMLICGSTAAKSHTRVLLKELSNNLDQLRIPNNTWDLREQPLPIADPDYHHEPERHPDPMVQRFIQAAREADGFALASPLYHGSFSGVLKNALDHLWYDAFRHKPVALLAHGASERRSAAPILALQPVVSTLFGYSIQTQVSTGPGDYTKDSEGEILLSSSDIKTRVARQAEELVRIAGAIKASLDK